MTRAEEELRYRKGPLTLTLEFFERDFMDGEGVVYTCMTKNVQGMGKDAWVSKAIMNREIANGIHPYAWRAAVRTKLAAQLVEHVHKDPLCKEVR